MSSSGGSAIKLIHRIFFSVILVVSIVRLSLPVCKHELTCAWALQVAMSIAAALVAYYEKSGYPNNEYRDRIRICLAAGIWSTLVSAYLLIGFLFAALSQAFNIFVHLILLLIAFVRVLLPQCLASAEPVHVMRTDPVHHRRGVLARVDEQHRLRRGRVGPLHVDEGVERCRLGRRYHHLHRPHPDLRPWRQEQVRCWHAPQHAPRRLRRPRLVQ